MFAGGILISRCTTYQGSSPTALKFFVTSFLLQEGLLSTTPYVSVVCVALSIHAMVGFVITRNRLMVVVGIYHKVTWLFPGERMFD